MNISWSFTTGNFVLDIPACDYILQIQSLTFVKIEYQFFTSVIFSYQFVTCVSIWYQFFTHVRNWYRFFKFVKIAYQFFTFVRNWSLLFTLVKIEYQFFTSEKNRTSSSQTRRIHTDSSQVKNINMWNLSALSKFTIRKFHISKSNIFVPILHTVWNLRYMKFAAGSTQLPLHERVWYSRQELFSIENV